MTKLTHETSAKSAFHSMVTMKMNFCKVKKDGSCTDSTKTLQDIFNRELTGVWISSFKIPFGESQDHFSVIVISDKENGMFGMEVVDIRITRNGHERKKWHDYAVSLI